MTTTTAQQTLCLASARGAVGDCVRDKGHDSGIVSLHVSAHGDHFDRTGEFRGRGLLPNDDHTGCRVCRAFTNLIDEPTDIDCGGCDNDEHCGACACCPVEQQINADDALTIRRLMSSMPYAAHACAGLPGFQAPMTPHDVIRFLTVLQSDLVNHAERDEQNARELNELRTQRDAIRAFLGAGE